MGVIQKETILLRSQIVSSWMTEQFNLFLSFYLFENIEFRILVRKNVERFICVRPRLVEEHAAIVDIAEDITAQKLYKKTIKKYSDKKNSILKILSHDLASPLGMIQVLSKTLKKNLQSNEDQTALEMLNHIEKAANNVGGFRNVY